MNFWNIFFNWTFFSLNIILLTCTDLIPPYKKFWIVHILHLFCAYMCPDTIFLLFFNYLSPSAKHSAEGWVLVWRAYTQKATICFLNIFFCKQMAVACSIFTLDGGFQLFCAAFDMPVTGVALKVTLGYKKMFFGHFKKIIMMLHLDTHLVIII